MISLKSKIKEVRELLCFTADEIAKVLNIDVQDYLDAEEDLNFMYAHHVKKLSEFYDISADFLLGLKPDPISVEFKSLNVNHEVKYNMFGKVNECNYEKWCNPLIVKYCQFSSNCTRKKDYCK